MSWLSFMFEAGMATLMVVLIVYCVKLNRGLTQVRSHNAEIDNLIDGLREASDRAEASVQRLKAAGLSAERSVRAAIEDAAVVGAEIAQATTMKRAAGSAGSNDRAAPGNPRTEPGQVAAGKDRSPGRSSRPERDILMAAAGPSTSLPTAANASDNRPRTREEAEETVLEAIRTARAGT